MAERDPLRELSELAQIGEQYADPLPPGVVRAKGTQRRRRRHALATAAVATVVAVMGGAVLSQTGLTPDNRPNPAATPAVTAVPATPTPTPARRLTADDLLTTAEVPLVPGAGRVVVTDPSVGRQPDQLSACQAGSAEDLGAVQKLARNFHQESADRPPVTSPDIYTLTLQFESVSDAAAALATYTEWLRTCPSRLAQAGYEVSRTPDYRTPIPIPAGTTKGSAFAFSYLEPGASEVDGTFENVGLLPVEDRLLILVRTVQGQDDNLYYLGDPVEGMTKHPFYAMMATAAKKLA
ncbi:MAG TPA: hypothetical protein VFP89_10935 [Propionibacteriaceae bacterium]|nr:hypothetical protein [Propionibacteriaceae bacterium]